MVNIFELFLESEQEDKEDGFWKKEEKEDHSQPSILTMIIHFQLPKATWEQVQTICY